MSRGSFGPPRRSDKSSKRRKQTFLQMERMEDRLLLANRVVSTILDTGAGSLRQALIDAAGGNDTIQFNIAPGGANGTAPFVIKPAVGSPLPDVPANTTFDVASQTGTTPNSAATGSNASFSVVLDGSLLGLGGVGLKASGIGSTIRGLSFINFQTAAIQVTANNVQVAGDWIGLNSTGAAAANADGVQVTNASGVKIGGPALADRNVISGNTGTGISIGIGTTAITVVNNYVGTDKLGLAAIGNATGILVSGANGLTIGTTTANARNVIGGNTTAGISVQSNNTTIIGNYVGLNAAGTLALTGLPASGDGILVGAADGTVIGGVVAGQRNFVSGNVARGIGLSGALSTHALVEGNSIGVDSTGLIAVPNSIGIDLNGAPSNTIGGTVAGSANLVSGNTGAGIRLTGTEATLNVVLGNSIGLGASGLALGNAQGVLLTGAAIGNSIGGVTPNFIAGNTSAGIEIDAGANLVAGNWIGLNAAGTAVGNLDGVVVNGVAGSTIGGITAATGNTISGNTNRGLWVKGAGATGTSVLGNWIGLNAAGTGAVGNSIGILVDATAPTGLTIGGAAVNVVSGNTKYGIEIDQAGETILNDYVGTNATGTAAVANSVGIFINNVATTTIGGTGTAPQNLISGNTNQGILISGAGSTGTVVNGNYIGTDLAGNAAVPNSIGVDVNGPTGLTIGGAAANQRNVISGNSGADVEIQTSGNKVLGNYLGTNAAGAAALTGAPANGDGVLVNNVANVSIGGAGIGEGNVISGNGGGGIHLVGASAGTATLLANIIGLDATKATKIANGKGIWVNGPTGFVIDGSVAPLNTISGNSVGIQFDSAGNKVIHLQLIGNNTGILVNNVAGTTIGGTNALTDQNTISGSTTGAGIDLEGANASTTVIQGNWIGLDTTGAAALGNSIGIKVHGPTAFTLDGSILNAANTISGNTIGLEFDTGGNKVFGQQFGRNAALNATIANTTGVLIQGSASNTVGGTGNQKNTIIGSTLAGVRISGAGANTNVVIGNDLTSNADGVKIEQGAKQNTVGGLVAGSANTITGSSTAGVEITGAGTSQNVVSGSTISGNTGDGVLIGNSASNNTVGGTTAAERNILSGNTLSGVEIASSATANRILGNYIGTDALGTIANANTLDGVRITAATSNVVSGNLISGNTHEGVQITGLGSTANSIVNNTIGLGSGGATIGNTLDGVLVTSLASNNTIGAGNLISGNLANGVVFSAGATNNFVTGSLIGTNAAGTSPFANNGDGVLITGATNNQVGITGGGNTISGNGRNGVEIAGASTGNTIAANWVGLGSTGLALANALDGVLVTGLGTSSNSIGAGSGNTISGNAGNGVEITASASGNQVVSNFIGTDTTGLLARPNTLSAVLISAGASGNTIGANNSIGFSNKSGVEINASNLNVVLGSSIFKNTLGGVLLTNGATSNTVGGLTPNAIYGNSVAGVEIDAASNVVAGNFIGLDALGAGGPAQANPYGVIVNGVAGSTIGGATGNTISGNTNAGIWIKGAGATSVNIQGNLIGLNTVGAAAIANSIGVLVDSTAPSGLVIGGAIPNTISGNAHSGVEVDSAGTKVAGNWIGLNKLGTAGIANSVSVFINNVANVTIGGTTPAERNIISGSTNEGLLVAGAGLAGTTILGNWIGLNAAGTGAVANSIGIRVDSTAPAGLVIGGSTPNTISGNTNAGIEIDRAGTKVAGNWVGLNAAGNGAVANSVGILVNNVSGVTLGGTLAAEINLISGNTNEGVLILGAGATGLLIQGNQIGLNAAGTGAVANLIGVRVDSTAPAGLVIGGTTPNTISGNTNAGIQVDRAGTKVAGNRIGLNVAGNGAVGNGFGVLVNNVANVSVGGTTAAERNTISGNTNVGILIQGAGSTGVSVQGNLVGTDIGGTTAVGNSIGIRVASSAPSGVVIGGATANTVSGNTSAGIQVDRAGTKVIGNLIGLNATGNNSVTGAPANGDGILVNNVANVTIGGAAAGQGNVISGNAGGGIHLVGASAGTATLLANIIGLDPTKAFAIPNGKGIWVDGPTGFVIDGGVTPLNTISGNSVGIQFDSAGNKVIHLQLIGNNTGVLVNNVANTTIGGTNGTDRNTISGGTTGAGIDLEGANASTTVIQGNWIGLDTTGAAALGNSIGIKVHGPTAFTLDGTVAGAANTISANTIGLEFDTGGNAVVGQQFGRNAALNATIGNVTGVLIQGTASNTVGGLTAAKKNTIIGSTLAGVRISGTGANTNVVIGNDLTSNADGVKIEQGAKQNTVGGLVAGSANTITGSSTAGVEITGAGTSQNVVSGSTISGNTGDGVLLGNSASNNTVGPNNSIGGNSANGIEIFGANSNLVLTSLISGNTNDGVLIHVNATGNTVGGGNTITGNTVAGVEISGAGASSNLIGGSTPNIISGNTAEGVLLASSGNTLGGNIIGLNAAGAVLANGIGVVVSASGNTIGGTTAALHNTISANTTDGLQLNSSDALVVGNTIGLNLLGLAQGNGQDGVRIAGADNSVGGATAAERNVISANVANGVEIVAGGTGNTITGNYVGLDATGILAAGNGVNGVRILNASDNTISSNVVAANQGAGVSIEGLSASSNVLTGNTIGHNALNAVLANVLDGVKILAAIDNTVGAGNLIADNLGNGVDIDQASATGNRVFGSTISGNAHDGVLISGGATGNVIDAANSITGNTLHGIEIQTGSNTVSGNTIKSNNHDGVLVSSSANVVNGGNSISLNLNSGVELSGVGATNNSVSGNSISSNTFDGVRVSNSASNNSIIAGNTISANSGDGVQVLTGANHTTVSANLIQGNSDGVFFNNTAHNVAAGTNTISGNTQSGVEIGGALAVSNLVGANTISGNTLDGVFINTNATNNTVGAGATISGNLRDGIQIAAGGNSVTGAIVRVNAFDGILISGTSNTVTGSSITTNTFQGVEINGAGGSSNVLNSNTISGNLKDGVLVVNAANNSIAAGNSITGNLSQGVELTGAGSTGNELSGSFLSTNVFNGVLITAGASGNLVDSANTISANQTNGVQVDSNSNTISGNSISSNTFDGVLVNGGSSNLVDGNNTISGNFTNGLEIKGGGATANVVTVNSISGNLIDGVLLDNNASGNTIGSGNSIAGNLANGVRLTSGASSNLVGGSTPNTISGNFLAGVELDAPSNTIAGNWIGLDTAGTGANANANGVIVNGGSGSTIGGITAATGNTISGNTNRGVWIRGALSSNLTVEGNVIGLDHSGLAPLHNSIGLLVDASAPSGLLIGGVAPNTISGNTSFGVEIDGSGTQLAGNWIGLDKTGANAIANSVGVFVSNAANVVVGGPAAVDRNVISGNTNEGVLISGAGTGGLAVLGNLIGTEITGLTAVPNNVGVHVDATAATGLTIGGSTPNTISGNAVDEVLIDRAGTTVSGDWIGLNSAGAAAVVGAGANTDGILVNNVSGAVVTGNSIGGLGGRGIAIVGVGAANALIQGNRVGTDITGATAVANKIDIQINQAGGATIGGLGAGQGNLISGATLIGVDLVDSSNDQVLGNTIGLNAAGLLPIASPVGVSIHGVSASNLLSRNLIASETVAGVLFDGAGVSLNTLSGNTIGLNAAGNALGNLEGVLINNGSFSNLLDSNTISGNLSNGVDISAGANRNLLTNNLIGTDTGGTLARPNGGDGVLINGASRNTIGSAGAGNTISANLGYGVEIKGVGGVQNLLLSNLIGLVRVGLNLVPLPNQLGAINIVDISDNTVGVGNTIGSGGSNNGLTLSGPNAINNLITGVTIIGGLDGLLISNQASNNTIGPNNTFKNNLKYGVEIDNATHNTIFGSTITGNSLGGVFINNNAANNSIGGGNLITGNIGDGVQIAGGATANTVGGAIPNTISGNTGNGVELDSAGNLVAGNVIGLDALGAALPNSLNGVLINNAGPNTIGGTTPALHNTIAGNTLDGIQITGASAIGNLVEGNTIGLNQSGAIVANGGDGIRVTGGASGNSIGGGATQRNVVSGNAGNGVELAAGSFHNTVSGNYVGLDAAGINARGNLLDGVTLNVSGNNLVTGNVVSGNLANGIRLVGAASTGNTITGNTVGLNISGASTPNAFDGVRVDNAPSNVVGPGNVVSDNGQNGVEFTGAGSTGNHLFTSTISGNTINGVLITAGATGTHVDMLNVITGNLRNGVEIDTGANTVSSNSIGANTFDGVLINNTGGNRVDFGNTITGNLANGVEVTGLSAINNTITANIITANSFDGVSINTDASHDVIGVDSLSLGNTISANHGNGVQVAISANHISILGNSISGNTLSGVFLNDTANNTLDQGNTISGNSLFGVQILGALATANTVLVNTISGNSLDGVLIDGFGNANTIGAGATISGNLRNGVQITSNGNIITGASITGNAFDGVLVLGTTNLLTASTISANTLNGVDLRGPNNTLTLNLISANNSVGVLIDTASGNSIGLAGAGNTISANSLSGLEVRTTSLASLLSNRVDGNKADGILLKSSFSNTIGLGNVVVNNTSSGLHITGDGSSNNLVIGSSFGVDSLGNAGANAIGVTIDAATGATITGNTIGGAVLGQGNTISGNTGNGLNLTGVGVSQTLIQNNLVGLVPAGTTTRSPNGGEGIQIDRSAGNTIGGLTPNTGNVLSNNHNDGLAILNGSDNNQVLGNLIGTSADGLSAAGNSASGVLLVASSHNLLFGNTISANRDDGLLLLGATSTGNQVVSNTIGLSKTGAALGNSLDGILLADATGNTIGGTSVQGNLVSANLGNGIELRGEARQNLVSHNQVGLDLAGVAALGNTLQGIRLDGTLGAAPNGLTGNSISSNNIVGSGFNGLEIIGAGAVGNSISSNLFGLNTQATPQVVFGGNSAGVAGIQVTHSAAANIFDGNVLKGSNGRGVMVAAGAFSNVFRSNTIVGNRNDGVLIEGSNLNVFNAQNIVDANQGVGVNIIEGSTGNSISGNWIGLGLGGIDAGQGNNNWGVVVLDSPNNLIQGNGIAANAHGGVLIGGGASSGNTVVGNILGVASSGLVISGPSGSPGDGVQIFNNAQGNTISANAISGFSGNGVFLFGGANNNVLQNNRIGIDPTGVAARPNKGDGVRIDGGSTASNLVGPGNTISGNGINGVHISGGATNNRVAGDWIGIDASGNASVANQGSGVLVENSNGNTIGGDLSQRNFISGNAFQGVSLVNSQATLIASNLIGVNAGANAAVANGLDGIMLAGSPSNTIGPNNIISGNTLDGIFLSDAGSSKNKIVGNIIGLDGTGRTPIKAPNLSDPASGGAFFPQYGIESNLASNLTIGGVTDADRNIISGNIDAGIFITGDSSGQHGVANVISGNYIGTTIDGSTAAIPLSPVGGTDAGGYGVILVDSANNTIGGTGPHGLNVISGNHLTGLYMIGAYTRNNIVAGNIIGLDATGTKPLPNNDGIILRNAPHNLIGGLGTATQPFSNLISGNNLSGITVAIISNTKGVPGYQAGLPGTDDLIPLVNINDPLNNELIFNNWIGPKIDGTLLGSVTDGIQGNGQGIFLNSVQNVTIQQNVISGNRALGVQLFNNATVQNLDPKTNLPIGPYGIFPTTNNTLTANLIGVGPDGRSAVPNGQGVFINDASGNIIGGTTKDLGNVISGNLTIGLQIMGNNAGNNAVLNNTIGLDKSRSQQVPNDIGVFVNGVRNPIDPSNDIASNRRGSYINRLPNYGPTVDRVGVLTGLEGTIQPIPDTAPVTKIVINFSQYIDPTTARNPNNYHIQKLPQGLGAAAFTNTGFIGIKGPIEYDVISRRATFSLALPDPARPGLTLNYSDRFRLTITGTPPGGIKSRGTKPYALDGTFNSHPGLNFVTTVQRGVELAPSNIFNRPVKVKTPTVKGKSVTAFAAVETLRVNLSPATMHPSAIDQALQQGGLTKSSLKQTHPKK